MLYNVLVVDDNKRSAQGLAAMIGVLGHTVGVAYGPRMALQSLNEVIPDVIFLDVNMPGISGLEVLRYLRRDPYTRNVPVVIISANDAREDIEEARDAGANYYIIKPPTLEAIEEALETVIPAVGPAAGNPTASQGDDSPGAPPENGATTPPPPDA